MIKPPELDNEQGREIWETITAAAAGDVSTLRRLLVGKPGLARCEFWYTQPIHFAVREGHVEAVRLLLESGADPADGLLETARDRGYESIARLLEEDRERRGRILPAQPRADHPIHTAAEAGDVGRVRAFLDAYPALLDRGDSWGGTPLHRAVIGSAREVIELLLDRGADVHAVHGDGPGSLAGYAPRDAQAIDFAIWGGPRHVPPTTWRAVMRSLGRRIRQRRAAGRRQPCAPAIARRLLARGAAHDLTIASALGDLRRVRTLLDEDPGRIHEARPNGRRPLSAAVEFGHEAIARLLLDRGADPNWPEGDHAPRGAALHAAARTGNRSLVELLLGHGADPNSEIDSAGSATYAARTPELRALLMARGGKLDPYDLVWMDEDDAVVRRVREDPASADRGCGCVFTAVVTRRKRDLLARLLAAGVRVPPVVTGCQSYLLEDPDMLRMLLESGMDPDLPNWQRQTLLHALCGRDMRGRAREHRTECAAILLDAGASVAARDDEYRSTPLAWAARNDIPDMVRFLLARGAPASLPDDPPWATPLAWATRRGHREIVDLLHAAGAAR